jgi:uncharacterized membrane protein HdeD (DUF308 family)
MLMTPITSTKVTDVELADELSRNWWVLLVWGAISILAGTLVLEIRFDLSALAVLFGALFIFYGITQALTPPMDGGSQAWSVVVGLLDAAAGVAIIAWPEPTLLVVAVFIGAFLLFSGLIEVVGSIANRDMHGWWLVLILGLLQIVLGLWALRRPGLALSVIVTIAGIWAVAAGVLQVVVAFEVKNLPRRLGRSGS